MKSVLYRNTPAHSERRAALNMESAKHLYRLLESAAQNPRDAPQELVAAWDRQGTLAKLNLPDQGIAPMSLNTLKGHAEEIIAGGWKALDAMRKRAKDAHDKHLKQKAKPSRGSRQDLQRRLDAANEGIQRYINEVAEFAEMYFDLLKICRSAAQGDPILQSALERHRLRHQRHLPKLRIVEEEDE